MTNKTVFCARDVTTGKLVSDLTSRSKKFWCTATTTIRKTLRFMKKEKIKMIKANKALYLTKGDRIERMPKGTYIEVYNAPSDANFLVSDDIGTHMGFKLHRREVAHESNISISTYRLVGCYAEIRDIEISSLIECGFRNATEEEIRIIQHNACLC